MSTAWVIVALAVAAAVVSLVMTWLRGDRSGDLGAVSDHWISEHRLGSSHDPRP